MHSTAKILCATLQNNGFEAVFAGGSVRDMILGRTPKDIDIATNALPEQIEFLFTKTFSIGKSFGVILVEEEGYHFEIATFRNDSGYSDHRRPDAVFFTEKKEDALRRDFTANALFWDPISDEFFDFVGGLDDIQKKILRFVGNPLERITEDSLRILRAVRFRNRFGFEYGEKVEHALQTHAAMVTTLSPHRIREELSAMLASQGREKCFEDLFSHGILQHILPEVCVLADIIDGTGDKTVWEHVCTCLSHIPRETQGSTLGWGILLHDIGKAPTLVRKQDRNHFPNHENESETMARRICKRLSFSRWESDKIRWLCKNHIPFYQIPKMTRVHRLHFYDHPFFLDLLELCRCDSLGSDGNTVLVDEIRTDYQRSHDQKLLPQFHEHFLSGREIMEILGCTEGKHIGQIKAHIRHQQIEGILQTQQEASVEVKKIWKEMKK